jgi:YggT family protein
MTAFDFLLKILFDTYLMIVVLRVWLQIARADFYNPFCQFIVKATDPLVLPMRRVIPGVLGIDMAGVVLALIVAYSKFSILMVMGSGEISVVSVLIIGTLFTIKKIGVLLFWVLLIRAIMSWISQGRHPIEQVMSQLSEPLLSPIRRRLPEMGGLDLSLMVVSFSLLFLNMLANDILTPLIGPIWASL